MQSFGRCFLILILFSVGCTAEKPLTGYSSEQLNAHDSINYSKEKYDYYQNIFENLSSELDMAQSRGVDISAIKSYEKEINNDLTIINDKINLAIYYYSVGQYFNSYDTSQNAITLLEELNPVFNESNILLELAYENTIANYRKEIRDNEIKINIASAYVEDAKNAGANIKDLDSELTVTFDSLGKAKYSFANMEFNKISSYLVEIPTKTETIQEDALYSKREHLTTIAIEEVNKIIKTDESQELVDDASAEKNRGNFQNTVHFLNKALILDVLTEYQSNKAYLTDYTQKNNILLGTDPIDSVDNQIESYINQGDFSEATKLLPSYKEKVEQASYASIEILNARLAIETLRNVSYLGAKPDSTHAELSYRNAVTNLENGDYTEAHAESDASLEESFKAKDIFHSKVETNPIIGIFSKFLAIFGKGPPGIVFDTVDSLSFSWSQIPETLIHINLSPPDVDIETGKLESFSSPTITIPKFDNQKEFNPVDFKLVVPEPSYAIRLKIHVTGTATIENIGDSTAHNVRIKFELFSGDGKRIKVNDQDYLEKVVGELRGGETKSENVDFYISLSDGASVQSHGGRSIYNIYSSEKNKKIEDIFTV